MKQLTAVLVMAAVVGFNLMAVAQDTTVRPSALYGKVVSVDVTGGKIVVQPKEGAQVTVTTDANTKIKVSDKDATLGDIKPDMGIRVSPATGTAANIVVYTPKPPSSR